MNRQGGVVSHNCVWEMNSVLRRMAREGDLASVLPGIFAAANRVEDPMIRMRAAHLRDPDVVFTGLSAAHLLWDIRHSGPVCATGRTWSSRPGFRFSETAYEPEWVTERLGLRCTSDPLTAVDLIPEHGGRFVDHLLRRSPGHGLRVLQSMKDAVAAHPNRPGNPERRRLLHESRDEPWSEAERQVHRQLRAAGLRGWRANHAIETTTGRVYFLDIAFPEERLVIEVDGYEFHSDRESFERDRERQNDLVADGWIVLRLTWAMIQDGAWLVDLSRALSTSRWAISAYD